MRYVLRRVAHALFVLASVSVLAFLFIATAALGQSIDPMIDRQMPALLETYKTLHASPELSMQEEKTSARISARLRELGYTVADHIGNYEVPGATCYGIIAMMKNGKTYNGIVRKDTSEEIFLVLGALVLPVQVIPFVAIFRYPSDEPGSKRFDGPVG